MKTFKKLLTFVMTAVMSVSLATVPAIAEGEETTTPTTYSITISTEESGHSYSAYQVFKGTLQGTEPNQVLVDVTWGNGVNDSALLIALKANKTVIKTVTGEDGTTSNVTLGSYFTNCTTAADVAEVLSSSSDFTSNSTAIDAFAKVVAANLSTKKTDSGDATKSGTKYTHTISGLAAGYYFVKDNGSTATGEATSTSKYILKVVKNVTVDAKTDVPSVEKKVKENTKYTKNEGYGTSYNDVADYNIGDTVPFRFYGLIPDVSNYTTYTYKFTDIMSQGLTLNADSIKVYIVDKQDSGLTSADQLTKDTDYTVSKVTPVTKDGTVTGETTFSVSISDAKTLFTGKRDKYVIVDYSATLNGNAVIGLNGNPNEVYLTYSNNPNDNTSEGDTPHDKVIVFTYELDVKKIDGATASEATPTTLKDAEFVLMNSTETKYAKITREETETNGWIIWVDSQDNATVLKSNENGLFTVPGLDDGTYYLKETKAPDTYNLLKEPIKIEVKATTTNGQNWTDGTASNALTALQVRVDDAMNENGTTPKYTDGNTEKGSVSITVQNNKGSTLPETGGMGTTIIYIVGGLMVVVAGVVLISKKRAGAK